MNTQKYNIIIDHQFHSNFKIVQGYGEMSSEINVIVHCARIHHRVSLTRLECSALYFGAEGEAVALSIAL